jgi:hypothetical protein
MCGGETWWAGDAAAVAATKQVVPRWPDVLHNGCHNKGKTRVAKRARPGGALHARQPKLWLPAVVLSDLTHRGEHTE